MREIINKLILTNKTISTMESCTGGGLANEITSYEDASKVLKFSAVTYSNEYKIKMGVDEEIINKYTVYSIQTAHSMASSISLYTNSNYGVGITGKLNKVDTNNPYGEDNIVFHGLGISTYWFFVFVFGKNVWFIGISESLRKHHHHHCYFKASTINA